MNNLKKKDMSKTNDIQPMIIGDAEDKRTKYNTDFDPVNKPKGYNSHPSGIECIQITEYYNFCIGNAIKYLWRAGLKPGEVGLSNKDKEIQDLEKAIWYINRQISNLKK